MTFNHLASRNRPLWELPLTKIVLFQVLQSTRAPHNRCQLRALLTWREKMKHAAAKYDYLAVVADQELQLTAAHTAELRRVGLQLCQVCLTVGGADVSGSLGELMTRCFHLKLAHWGKEQAGEGEVEALPSRQLAQLASADRAF